MDYNTIEREIVAIRDKAVADRLKVDGPEWRAVVKRCVELRRLQKNFKKRGPKPKYKERTNTPAAWVRHRAEAEQELTT
jgi:hypothetical protein